MKILIAGVGHLGSQVAMMSAMLLKPERIILYDIKDLKGDILDLQHACFGLGLDTEITESLTPVDYAIIAAGKARSAGQGELESALYPGNIKTVWAVIRSLIEKGVITKATTLIILTNPVLEITKDVKAGMPGYQVHNPEEHLLRIRKGKELGMEIIRTKGYTNFGAAVSCIRLLQELEEKRESHA
jgi:malate/lactate dehydrogenase